MERLRLHEAPILVLFRDPLAAPGFRFLQQAHRVRIAMVARKPVPEVSLLSIPSHAAVAAPAEKGGIEGLAHPQCRPPVSCLGRPLVTEPRRGNIAHLHEDVAARDQRRGRLCGEAGLNRCGYRGFRRLGHGPIALLCWPLGRNRWFNRR